MSAQRLVDVLRMAVCQNEHDMLMTGEELRSCREALAAHDSNAAGGEGVPDGWQPIETAPKDNKRPLLIANFNADNGDLTAFDYNACWEGESESWEIPRVYYFWASENGTVEEPTHWSYQPEWFATAPSPQETNV